MAAGKITEVQVEVWIIKSKADKILQEVRNDFQMNDKSLLSIQALLGKQSNLSTKKNKVLECHAYSINTVHAINAPKETK